MAVSPEASTVSVPNSRQEVVKAKAAPPFDDELLEPLRVVNSVVPSALTLEMLLQLRAPVPPIDEISSEMFSCDEHVIPDPSGEVGIPALVCRPRSQGNLVPALFYLHGGGMVIGDNRTGLGETLELAGQLSCAVVSIGYRLAPENPHPAPFDDAYNGLVWLVEHAAELGIDAERIVIAGVSAGAGLAAAVALAARDRGGPALLGQLLCSPMLDDRNSNISAVQLRGTGNWDQSSNTTGWAALLGNDAGGETVSPYAAPARATDLADLPPAFIDVGSAETFRDEDLEYASRIWQNGGKAELHVWPGGFHGFDILAPTARLSRDARAARIQWLRRLLNV